jgi:hypothetical protein
VESVGRQDERAPKQVVLEDYVAGGDSGGSGEFVAGVVRSQVEAM